MSKINYRDITGGILLFLVGVAFGYTAFVNYPLGTLRRMGPGFFPACLGLLLSVLGVLIALNSLRTESERPDVRIFSPIFILGGVAAFALSIETLGLVPALILTAVISSCAELRVRPINLLILCCVLSLIAPIIFIGLLGLQIPLFNWPS